MNKNDSPNRGKWALVTGSSSGIGWELARLFAQAGFNLILVARSEPKLTLLADELRKNFDGSLRIIVKDLSPAFVRDPPSQTSRGGPTSHPASGSSRAD